MWLKWNKIDLKFLKYIRNKIIKLNNLFLS